MSKRTKRKAKEDDAAAGHAGGDALAEYRRKRDFARTREPSGGGGIKRTETGRLYLIQKHDARNLHYDLRLEMDGVLKSWAVPRGPSLDPSQKMLAVHVEDHPIEYGSFEGIIPQGEYGGGTVMLWDRGTWEPITDPVEGFKKGDFKFRLHGEKLEGDWVLVRTKGPVRGAKGSGRGGRSGQQGGAEGKNWLLIKKKDEFARPVSDYNVLAQQARSVLSGRAMAEIAEAPEEVWTHSGAEPTAHAGRVGLDGASNGAGEDRGDGLAAVAGASGEPPRPGTLSGAKKATLPDRIRPALAELVAEAPKGDDWIHEIKLDGYRLIAVLQGGKVTLRTRNWHDWTDKFPQVARSLSRLAATETMLDGEVVVLDSRGISDFQSLQNAFRGYTEARFTYFVFDAPYALGYDLKCAPLIERKRFVKQLLATAPMIAPTVQYCDHIVGRGPQVFEQAAAAGLEGIISKRAGSHYETKRSAAWVKVKATRRQDFVIGGFSEPQGSRQGFGAILVGAHDPESGRFAYCGRVGTGFSDSTLSMLAREFAARLRKTPPFEGPINDPDLKRVYWVEPELVADVEFIGWTDEEVMRHPSFKGLRPDVDAAEVVLEGPREGGDGVAKTERKQAKKSGRKTKAVVVKKKSAAGGGVVRKAAAPADAIVRGVRISHPDRVVYPDAGFTKQAVAEYYAQVEKWILPHVVKRPLTVVRCPQGLAGESFYQRHVGAGFPEAVKGVMVEGEDEPCITVNDLEGVLSLVQFGVLEIHSWGSDLTNTEKPDHLVFDLDPGPGIEWGHIVAGAGFVRDFLTRLGLQSFVKTSGGKGIHLVVPVARRQGWDEAKKFCKGVADRIVKLAPKNFVSTMTKTMRQHRIFVDYLRNQRGATAVAPYSTRAREPGAVSMPLAWEELSEKTPPKTWTLAAAAERMRGLAKEGRDPWAGYWDVKQGVTAKVLKKLEEANGQSKKP